MRSVSNKPAADTPVIPPGGTPFDHLVSTLQRNTTYLWNVRAKGDRKITVDSAWGNSGSDMTFQTGQ